MNENVKKAYEKNRAESDWKVDYLPEVEVGEVVELNDIWSGDGDDPTELGSCSYKITDNDWINYVFDVIEKKENILDTLVRINEIELL